MVDCHLTYKNPTMKNLSLYIVLLLLALNINAQQSGDLDTTFGKAELTNGDSSRFNNGVKKLIIQPDGNILAGGILHYITMCLFHI